MKTARENISEKSLSQKRHPVRQKLLSVLLCACLLLASLPMEGYGSEVQAEESQRKILSFSELPEEVKYQTVEPGTPLEELNLPEILEAVCVPAGQDSNGNPETLVQPEESPAVKGTAPEDESLPEETQEVSQNTEKTEVPEETQEFSGNDNSEEELPVENETEETEPPAENGPEEQPESPVPDTEPGTGEVPEENPEAGPETDTDSNSNSEETVVIEHVTWTGTPAYDSETEGVYVFAPVLPEGYVLAEGVGLPEVQVIVESTKILKKKSSEEVAEKSRAENRKEEIKDSGKRQAEKFDYVLTGNTVIENDTEFEKNHILYNGSLIIKPGVTLTVKGTLTIEGSCSIYGGGKIVRGNPGMRISVKHYSRLGMRDITVDGVSLPSQYAMIETAIQGVEVTLSNCIFKNLVKDNTGGAVLSIYEGTATVNDTIVEECSSSGAGGAFSINKGELSINGGEYKNNRTTDLDANKKYGGGFLCCINSKLSINGGNFIGNSSPGKGGCIYTSYQNSETYLQGGHFKENICSYPGYEGSGAIFCEAENFTGNDSGKSVFDLSGDVQFCGDDVAHSGTDGFYLNYNSENEISPKIQISNTLRYPLFFYSKAFEEYVFAEGTNELILLHERDVKNINFTDVEDPDAIWYPVLDKENNRIYLSKTNPEYNNYYVYYINNGVKGAVIDNNAYQIGDIVRIKPGDALEHSPSHCFKEWNTKADGTGEKYHPADEIVVQGNIILYANFETKRGLPIKIGFHSGDRGLADIRYALCEYVENATPSMYPYKTASVVAPEIREIEGWNPVGWKKYENGIQFQYKPGDPVYSTNNNFCVGVYERKVKLLYKVEKNNLETAEIGSCYMEIYGNRKTYKEANFKIAPGPDDNDEERFKEWNTKADGTGQPYKEGDTLKTVEDTTLYAVFEEKEKFTADFYSGGANQKETIVNTVEDTVSGADITVPELQEMAGWKSLGWNKSKGAYTADAAIRPGRTVTLTEPLTEYYGIYEKDITLSYDSNGGGEAPAPEKKACYASVHQKITQKYPDFTIAGAIRREGHTFVEWNTAPDGTGTSYEPGSTRKLEEDTLLYAVWKETSAAPEPSEPSGPSEPEPSGPDAPAPETAPYRVEYYCQNLTGEEYTRMDSDTELLTGTVGTEVEAQAQRKTYTGFTLNLSHPSGKSKGAVERDGSLVLKLYYDRLIYEVDFSLNGGQGKAPDMQKVRYGGLLEQVSDPVRRGYNFKGWYMDDKGLEGGIWDFGSPVEHNTGTLHTTLYAKWADELAPAMGKASFSRGSRDFLDWLIQKESMVVTVPVTEEGSGLEKAEYLLVAEGGTEQDGQAAFTELHTMTDTMAAYGSSAAVLRSIRGEAESGSYEARIAIEEEFKGKVYLTCTDYAGNVSAQKTLTAEGGGVIVEDNAPEIRFDGTKETAGGKPLEVKVEVRDSEEDHVTSGISGVRYQVDKKKSVSLPEEEFTGDFAEVCEFTVKIKGEGKHTLRVEAEDHAGNESAAEVTMNISGSREVPKEVPADKNPGNPGGPGSTGKPLGGEPQTGDSTHVQICATLAMISGFGYLLLYFEGENGITEQEKEEMIHRIVTWAKQGGRIRRLLGLAGIFLFLAYYHSIGKSVDVEWKEVYKAKNDCMV